MCTHTNLLIGIKGYVDITVFNFFMVAQIAHRLHNLSNAGFVVGTQQGVTVCHNQIFTDMVQQLRKFPRTTDDTLRQLYLAAIVVVYNLCLDISSRTIRTGIVVRDKTDGGYLFLDVRLQRGVNITFLVKLHIAEAFRLKFFF